MKRVVLVAFLGLAVLALVAAAALLSISRPSRVVDRLPNTVGAVPGVVPPKQLGAYTIELPERMRVGEEVAVKLRISPDAQLLSAQPAGTLRVAPRMSARLVGGDFDIDPPAAVDQYLESDGELEWGWHVKPKTAGDRLMSVWVWIRFEVDGELEQHQVLDKPLTAKVAPDLAGQVIAFATEHAQWLAGSVLIPLFGAALSVWRKRRGSGPHPPRRRKPMARRTAFASRTR
ncbi:MAG TPA: hypothetical protein VFG86_09730 [Chloroflexota bacterium]|nr:hypothetical protein [Chloroflexota bacterium]